MSVFGDLLGNWIQIIDEQNEITIKAMDMRRE